MLGTVHVPEDQATGADEPAASNASILGVAAVSASSARSVSITMSTAWSKRGSLGLAVLGSEEGVQAAHPRDTRSKSLAIKSDGLGWGTRDDGILVALV